MESNIKELSDGQLDSAARQPSVESFAAEPLVTFLQYLLNLPSRSEIIQHLVLHTFSKFEAWGACIVLNQEYGVLETAGQYGLGPGYKSSLDGLRSSVALQVEMDHKLEIGSTSGYMSPLGHSIVGSLFTPHNFLGFIQVFLPESINHEAAHDYMRAVCLPMSLLEELHKKEIDNSHFPHTHPYANGFHQNGNHTFENHIVSTANYPASSMPGAPNLTSRQLRVLELMSIGKTNIAIAEIIGYSESTVRQETMAIYRILGVHDRNDACKVAYELGIIKIWPDSNPDRVP
jgi:DNA-binding CsgD family transcriptional regulator